VVVVPKEWGIGEIGLITCTKDCHIIIGHAPKRNSFYKGILEIPTNMPNQKLPHHQGCNRTGNSKGSRKHGNSK